MIRALAASLALAYVAHSPALTSAVIPAAAAFAAAAFAATSAALAIHLIRRGRTAR